MTAKIHTSEQMPTSVRILAGIALSCLLLLLIPANTAAQSSFEDQYRSIVKLLPDEAASADTLAQALMIQVNSSVPIVDSLVGKSYYLLGLVEYYRSRFVLAEEYFKKALETNYVKGSLLVKDACLNNLGIIYDRKNRIVEALDCYTQSLRLAEQRGDSLSIVQSWINLSQLEHKRANRSLEFELCRNALEYSIRHRDSLNMMLTHQNIGLFYRTTGDLYRMSFHYREALRLSELLNNYTQKAHILVNMAESYLEQENNSSAEAILTEALGLCNKYDIDYLKVTVYLNLGNNTRDQGDSFPVAENYYREAEKLALALERRENLSDIYLEWANLYAKSGDYGRYQVVIAKYSELMEEQFHADSKSEYEQIQVLYGLDKLTAQKIQLESDVRARNRMLIATGLMIFILGFAVTVIAFQHIRLRRYVRTLYRLNVMEANSSVEPDTMTQFSPDKQVTSERYRAIIKVLTEEKLYLDPHLNIQRLTAKLATNQKYISQAINEHSGSNFYGLLKQLRISEARRLILQTGVQTNLQVIAEQSGYTNRFTFSRQFKEVTGFSPSEFIKLAGAPPEEPSLEEEHV